MRLAFESMLKQIADPKFAALLREHREAVEKRQALDELMIKNKAEMLRRMKKLRLTTYTSRGKSRAVVTRSS